jgi:histidyl-tRNA synthetase
VKVDTAPPRGMRDILPDEVELRDTAMARVLDVYRRHGFRRVETPALESLRLLAGGQGGENEKLIFKVLKRGDRLAASTEGGGDTELADLGLRFDLTVPLARYYAHNHARLPQPLKAIQIGPVWRAERPQRGRFRQFTQCDIDILGVASEVAEIELILATAEALLALGLGDLTLRINDRRFLVAIADHCGFAPHRFESVFITLDKLDKVGPSGVREELEAAGHAADAVARLMKILGEPGLAKGNVDDVLAALPADAGGDAARAMKLVMRAVVGASKGRFAMQFDPTLVRGMSYYTGQIFEIVHKDYPSSIAGGGRYDRMIGRLLGREVPACGFSIGFERIIAILQERGGGLTERPRRLGLLFDPEKDDLAAVMTAAGRLRAEGHCVSLEVLGKRLRKQLDGLASHGFEAYVLFGNPEIHRLVSGAGERTTSG